MCTKNCTYSFWQKFILCEEARLMKVWVIVPVLWMRQKNVNINTLMMNISRTLYVCSKRQWGTINLDYRFLTLAWTAYDAKRTDASGEQNISSSNICFLTYTGDWRQVWTQTNHVKLFKNTKANATYQNKSAKKKVFLQKISGQCYIRLSATLPVRRRGAGLFLGPALLLLFLGRTWPGNEML